MAFARPFADANGEFVRQRYTELSDVIRARNKREDRLLNVRLKFYERERNIRINMIRKDQYQLERLRTSLFKEAEKIERKTQNMAFPVWMSPRPKTQGSMSQMQTSEIFITRWDSTMDKTQNTADVLRCVSAR